MKSHSLTLDSQPRNQDLGSRSSSGHFLAPRVIIVDDPVAAAPVQAGRPKMDGIYFMETPIDMDDFGVPMGTPNLGVLALMCQLFLVKSDFCWWEKEIYGTNNKHQQTEIGQHQKSCEKGVSTASEEQHIITPHEPPQITSACGVVFFSPVPRQVSPDFKNNAGCPNASTGVRETRWHIFVGGPIRSRAVALFELLYGMGFSWFLKSCRYRVKT